MTDLLGDRVVLALLAIWAILFGIFSVTNVQVDWGRPVMGFAALILGVVCLIKVLR